MALAPAIAAAAQLDSATVTFIQHDVEIADIEVVETGSAGVTNRRKADVRDTLGRGNTLMTGRQSRAELQFNDGTIARLGQFTSFSFAPGTREMDLRRGTGLFHIPKGVGSTTRVRAGAITAGITGTTFLFQIFDDRVVLWVFEGTVVVGGVEYVAGQVVTLANDGRVISVQPFDPAPAAERIALVTRFEGSNSQELFRLMLAPKEIPPTTDAPGRGPAADAVHDRITRDRESRPTANPD